jgi:hypothetical protein
VTDYFEPGSDSLCGESLDELRNYQLLNKDSIAYL